MEYSADFIKEILARHGKILKRSLGQNFLFDKKILDAIVSAAVGEEKQNIVEIGAGVGMLTDLLCRNAKKVVTVEIDQSLPPLLSETVVHPNFSLCLKDILKTDLSALSAKFFGGGSFVLVGNLPYYITAKILDKLMADIRLFNRAVIMVQREVALRLQSTPGSKEYRAATVAAQALFDLEYICTVPSHCFVPAPHVDSAVLRLTPKKNSGVNEHDVPAFLAFTEICFAARRKQLKSAAKALHTTPENIAQSLVALGFPETARAESLTPGQLIDLFYKLTKKDCFE